MIPADKIEAAVRTVVAVARPEQVVVFGSHARGDAREDSDLDLLVIESSTPDRARRWGSTPGTATHAAVREGKVVYG